MDHSGETKPEPVNKKGAHSLIQSLELGQGPALGMICVLAATVCFATMQALIRLASLDVPPVEVAFFRSAFGLAFQIPLVIHFGLASLRTTRLGLHVTRGTFHAVSMMIWFVALPMIPLAEATALEFASPIMAMTIAILFLGEVVRVRRLVALGVGVAGMLIVVRPGFEAFSLGQMLCLGSIALWAVCQLMIRELGKTESSFVQGVYMVAVFTPITAAAAIPVWVWPSWSALSLMLLIAVIATIGTWLYSEAFRRAEMSAILPLESTKLIWSVGYGLIFFNETPEVVTLIGGFVIFGAAAYITLREAQIARQSRVTGT